MLQEFKSFKDYWKAQYKKRYGGKKGKEKKRLEMRAYRAKLKKKL